MSPITMELFRSSVKSIPLVFILKMVSEILKMWGNIWKIIFNAAPKLREKKDPILFLTKPSKKKVTYQINVLNICDESTEKIYDLTRIPNFQYKSIHNALKIFYGNGIKVHFVSSVYLSSVLEYFTHEVLNKAKEFLEHDENPRNEINAKHIYLALRGNDISNVLTKNILSPFPEEFSS